MKSAAITAFAVTDPGLKRSNNEDACAVYPDQGCAAVADGVGGAAAGEVASRLFISSVARYINQMQDWSEGACVAAIKEIFSTANEMILHHIGIHPECHGMSCTAELLLVSSGGFVVGHVGDSRSYRFRNKSLTRLTSDHTFVQQQLDKGELTAEEARKHRYRNLITRAVGNDEVLDVDIIRGRTRPGDLFLLCSDGLTDMVREEEITVCLGRDGDLPEKTAQLVAMANRAGGRDNITVALVGVA
ncbi:Stp1/IreP family PP2C-type Ser/Thr phosphatase [Desulfopila sp. IMCC35008]|uniref:Stp1/IreP family PP2C-type Ser/Thr phosphatase n=1 Tax=Desulfopila sp. IMCC35008 TaxID=2653858 RepID=UPI0013D31CD2|nr:Stp1/IreP family PP2C-type Ser/Thr phosphatase [Desulfopila sp. IMCC35008]